MAGGSEEYLASLGFDTSDVDKAVNQTITLLGHLGNQFGDISKKTERAERALLGVGKGARESGKDAAASAGDWLKLREALYDQSQAYSRISSAEKVAANTLRARNDASREAVEGIDRMSSGYDKMVAAEAALDRQSRRGVMSTREWDAAFKDATRGVEERNRVTREAVSGIDRMSANYDIMVKAENDLASARSRGFQTSRQQMSAWDAEFRALSKDVKAKEDAAAAQNKMVLTSPALRYALYDISLMAGVASAAITALGVASIVTAASFESAFVNVERTLDDVGSQKVEEIRQSLLQLSREIPKSFQDLSAIATLGNQLGIAADDVDEFTGTIARFSAVSGVSAEETAKVFGGLTSILGISATEFENLGSAITLVGRKSAATDAEILSLTKEIGQQATAAGFAASDVVALAGALGQLRVPPERSRGALTTYFQTLNMAVAEGGDKLEAFATVIGVTTSELESMVRGGQGTEIFQRFLESLRDLDNVDVTRALDALGLSQLRVSDTFQRLSSESALFNQYLGMSANAYSQGTELARQYGLVVETLASKWQLFLNALAEFGAAVGSNIAPAAAVLLDVSTKLLQSLAAFADTPMGKGLTIIVGLVAALTAAFLGLVAPLAAGVAGLVALRFAMRELGIEAATTTAGVWGLAGAALGLGNAATRAAVGWRILRLAMLSTGIGAIVAYIGWAIGFLVDFEGQVKSMRGPISFMIDLLFDFARSALEAARAVSQGLGGAFGWIPGATQYLANLDSAIATVAGRLGTLESRARAGLFGGSDRDAGSLKQIGALVGAGASAMSKMQRATEGTNMALGGSPDGGDSGGTVGTLRTLVDYANELQEVFSRAFDIRFGGETAADGIAKTWNSIRQAIADTNQQIRQYKAEMQTLTADRAIREYWLRVAENYKDTLRAGELRAEIAEIDAQLAKTSKDLTDAQEKNSKTVEGNSEAAISNREQLRQLVQQYQAQIVALASSGMSHADLQRKTEELRQSFIRQGLQLGYSRADLEKYAVAFDDVRTAINRLPKNVSIGFNPNPALQAIAELEARAKTAASGIRNTLGGALGGGGGALASDANATVERFKKMARLMKLQSMLAEYTGRAVGAAAAGNGASAGVYRALAVALTSIINGGSYRSGTAWTGSGNPWDIAGVVHNREAVLNERATAAVGPQFVNAANQGRNPWQYAPQTSSKVKFPDRMVVELSPVDRDILLSGGKVSVAIGGGDLSRATSDFDSDDNRRGGA